VNHLLLSQPVPLSEIQINEENILRVLQVPPDMADDYLKDLIHDLTEFCTDIATPLASCTLYDEDEILAGAGNLKISDQTFNIDKMVGSALGKSSGIAVFIGTCGEKPEQLSKKMLQEGNSLEGYIADIIGSEITEGVADYIQKCVESEMASRGLKITNRFSPGYCKWPVNEQQKLFSLMSGNNSGVHLTSSSLMIPIKSVSGIIGVGLNVKNAGYACNMCEMEQCLYRDLKHKN
jgi:hypothetical protein